MVFARVRTWLAALLADAPRPMAVSLEPRQAEWLLSLFAALYRQPVDSGLLERECVPPFAPTDFERLAGRIGFLAQFEQVSAVPSRVRTAPVPWAIEVRETGSSGDPRATDWVVVLRVDGEEVLIAKRGRTVPESARLDALVSRMTGTCLRIALALPQVPDPDAVADGPMPFGFGWFVPELLRHRVLWQEIIAASFVLQGLALGLPLFTQVILDKVIVHRTHGTLVALSVGMGVFMLFSALLAWLRQYLILHAGRRVDAVLGSQVLEHLFRLPLAFFHHRPTGVIAARLQGIETIRDFLSSAAVSLVLDLPFLLLFIAIMGWYSVPLTAGVLAVMAVILVASVAVAPLFQSRLNEQFLRGAATQAFLTEYVAGMETVKALQVETQLHRRYRELLAGFLAASFRTRQLANTYNTFAGTLEQLMHLLILAFGASLVMTSTHLTIGMLVAFQMFASRVSQPLLRLVGLWQQFQQARLAVIRLGDLMNAPAERFRVERARAGGAGAITLEDLEFRHDEGRPPLFRALSLRVDPGQLVAVMGSSGCGKSTLVRLLQGFHAPTGGSIRIDGVDVRHLAANELRSHFGVVPQETTLFSGTILDNLRLAAPLATFEQVVAACRMAEVHATVDALPNGYQTVLGERGVGLSGGQRQRLAIARALLKRPRILLFDEATASLDPSTAEQVARTINSLKGRVTILFVAHVLPASLEVDQIVRIGAGVDPRAAGAGRPGGASDLRRAAT